MAEKRMHSLDSVLTFGKYKGLPVRAVLRFNARYFGWAVKNIEWFDMDAEARKVAQRAINKERQMALNQQEAWAWGFGRDARSARQKHDYRMIQIENEERRNAGQVCEHHPDGMMWWKLPNGERVDV